MLKLALIRSKKLPKQDDFLWRYMDLHKFIDLLVTKKFRYARMDSFIDPLEGIPMETALRALLLPPDSSLAKAILGNESLLNINLGVSGRIEMIKKYQAQHFVSCWFFSARESMAMWNCYSDSNGVAIKVPFASLNSFLKPNLDGISSESYYCGKVHYQDFRSSGRYPGGAIKGISKASLRKDVSFSHENEIRYVVKVNSGYEKHLFIESDPLKLEELDLKVICHPEMAEWKKNNIRKLLGRFQLKSAYKPSEILLRRTI